VIRSTQSTQVLVVGAGPYGLSTAAHLLAAGVETRVFGNPMAAWRNHMPRGMYLKSTFDASSLSAPGPGGALAEYCKDVGATILDDSRPLPLDMFVDYGLWFQRRWVGGVERTDVQRIAEAPGGFRVSLAKGDDVYARAVIVASGHICFAHVPDGLSGRMGTPSANGLVSHACQHADFSSFSRRVVAVVGAGQSALESAVLLREAGADVKLLVRGRSILWGSPPAANGAHRLRRFVKPGSPLGPGWSHFLLSQAPEVVASLPASIRLYLVRTVLGPSGGWWLRRRFEGNIEVALDTVVEEAHTSDSRVSLRLNSSRAASTLHVDHVLAATGYRVDVGSVDYLDPQLRERIARVTGSTAPRLSYSFESSVPGLYFTGLSAAATFGPLLRFVCGSEFTARRICASLARSRTPLMARRPRTRRLGAEADLGLGEERGP
jgi:thioredoxin reductase